MSLKSYVITRILMTIPMTFLLLTAVFMVMHVLPGDPVRALLGFQVPEDIIQAQRHLLGLDKPLSEQYFDYLRNVIIHRDLGISVFTRRPVTDLIKEAFPATLELTVVGMLFAIVLGFPTGIYGALKRDKLPDYVIRLIFLAGFSIPIFWLGMIFQYFFGLKLGWFPVMGRYSPLETAPTITRFATLDSLLRLDLGAFFDTLLHLVMPSLALSIYVSALLSRIIRANMIETLGDDYILTARAKGLTERGVYTKHALPNAILPVFTAIGLYFAILLGGAILTETVFSIPGMGTLLINGVMNRDYAVIQGCISVYVIAIVVITTFIDCMYAFLDPRIRF